MKHTPEVSHVRPLKPWWFSKTIAFPIGFRSLFNQGAVGGHDLVRFSDGEPLGGLLEVYTTLQGINISHLGKRKIIFKMPFLGDMLVPWRVLLGMDFFSVKS